MEVKKIMLVQPWNYHDENVQHHDLSLEWRNGPYSLLLLATQLKESSVPVRLIDLQPVLVLNGGNIEICLEYLRKAVFEFRPDIIGISFFSYQYNEVETIVRHVKNICRDIGLDPILIAGGIHASIEPKLTIERLGFDYAFVGEGDSAILDLAYCKDPKHVGGVISGNGSVCRPTELIDDLSSLPFPDWHLCDYKFYSTPSYGKISGRAARTLDLMMGRGCFYRCSFCAYPVLSKTRFYSAEYLVEQMRFMKDLYDIDSIYFIDSSIGNNRKLLRQFCDMTIQTGLAKEMFWYANMRANQVDEQLLRLMWKAGCRALLYGFESGSQKVLDLMNKKCTVEHNIKAAELHNRLKFPYHASMILGYPGETEKDIGLTFDFVQKLRPPMVGFNWYVPLPGSQDYDKLRQSGLIQVEDPHEWRRIGEVLTTGKIYADIEENIFRKYFQNACDLASKLRQESGMDMWEGPETTVSIQNDLPSHDILENNDTDISTSEKNAKGDFGPFSSLLREKWGEIPGTRQERVFSSDMLKWSDAELLSFWEECNRQTSVPEVRGWYQELYKDMFKGCEVADVGPGVGIDGIFFARHGANITFVDIVEDNLKLLERICTLKGIKAKYYYVDDFFNFHFENMFDVFLFIGSMINAPFEFTGRQLNAMTPFLRNGGKIGMLAYPKERYDLSGAKDCAEFGKMTDGERTPWCEWYNDDKITSLFGDGFRLEWSRNFGKDKIEFNWFDLTKIEVEKVLAAVAREEGKAVLNSRVNQPSGLWHNFKGEHLFANGDVKGSRNAFANALEKGPELTVVLNNIGVVYWQNGEIEKAMQFLQRALEIGPDDRDATFNYINILIVLNETEEAKKLYSDYLNNNKEDDEMTSLFSGIEMPNHIEIGSDLSGTIAVPIVHVKNLHKQLEIIAPIDYPVKSLTKSLNEWKMEIDDSPIFRYIYRNVRPSRHLEFGTWQGTGVLYCLEECDATVWTINLLHGENKPNGDVVYGLSPSEITDAHAWAEKIGLPEKDSYRTDTLGFIGRCYLDSGMENRVCQIYSDSRKWDISNYPTGFFDTVLIDGGHAKDIVISDTRKAFQLLRPGGVIMWHDFCPPLAKQNEVVQGVTEGICHEWQYIRSQTKHLFWIYPSWILLGIKK